MPEPFTIRVATADDAEFLIAMLLESANWPPDRNWSRERILADPATAHYVRDWPRPGDSGVVAVDRSDNSVGAAWLRHFTADDPGYGFVSPSVPELTIAVAAGRRGQGVGGALLNAVHDQARAACLSKISLSVERANPAQRLYAREGYRTVASGRDSDTMVVEL